MVYTINPLEDKRWAELSERHPHASIFHTTGWLEALRRTYGYRSVVYTTSPPGSALTNGVVFCCISSWLTGRRMVSLPFADHCEPLVDDAGDRQEIFTSLHRTFKEEKLKYIEIRPLRADLVAETSLNKGDSFYVHSLGLGPTLEKLFQGCQKDSIQRKVRRAEREGLCYEEGHSEVLLNQFYQMLVLTRRRHGLPPQPIEWFRNLIILLGDRLTIRVASLKGQPVASILTLRHGKTLVYKYGCSDARHHNLGGMPFLMWKAIEEAKITGLEEFDFGRSDLDNEGLIRFKDQWGTTRSALAYGRISAAPSRNTGDGRLAGIAQRAFGYMPDFLFTAAGRLLYRHMA